MVALTDLLNFYQNKMRKKNSSTAFSLVEISLVLTIISVIIVGMIKSQALIGKARLSNSQTLTKNSAVKDMNDVVAWYETSLETSFLFNEQKDGVQISVWQDGNANAASRNNAEQASTINRPKFYTEVFNGSIPGIRFDGENDFMTFNGSQLIGNSYTIFVVEQRRANSNLLMFLGGTDSANNANLNVGYASDASIRHSHYGANTNDFTIPAFSSPKPAIHTFLFNKVAGQKYWQNGGVSPEDSSGTFTTAISSFNGSAIGRYLGNYFHGDIAEIIIFNRALLTEERQIIETYLSQKYGISIS
jgi:competence protein ComGC